MRDTTITTRAARPLLILVLAIAGARQSEAAEAWEAAEAAKVCKAEPYVYSVGSEVETSIKFVNKTSAVRRVYWLDFDGDRVFRFQLGPKQSLLQETFLTHPWIVTDAAGNCRSVFYPDGQKRTVNISS